MAPRAVIERMGEPQKRLDTPPGEVWLYRGGRTALIFDHDKKLRWLTKAGCTNLPVRVSAPLTEGMTRHEVRERMGKPQTCFVTPDGEVWIYRGGEEVLHFASNKQLTWSSQQGKLSARTFLAELAGKP